MLFFNDIIIVLLLDPIFDSIQFQRNLRLPFVILSSFWVSSISVGESSRRKETWKYDIASPSTLAFTNSLFIHEA